MTLKLSIIIHFHLIHDFCGVKNSIQMLIRSSKVNILKLITMLSAVRNTSVIINWEFLTSYWFKRILESFYENRIFKVKSDSSFDINKS